MSLAKRIKIDEQSDVPIYQQIVDSLERQILTGIPRHGEFLTSVRDFAVEHSVNPNTVAKAYQALQARGLVESIRGRGLAVLSQKRDVMDKRRNELLKEKARELFELAAALDVSDRELKALMQKINRNRGDI